MEDISDLSSVSKLSPEPKRESPDDPTELHLGEKGTRLRTSGEGGGKRETKEEPAVSESAIRGESLRDALGGLRKSLAVTLEDQKKEHEIICGVGGVVVSLEEDDNGSRKMTEKDLKLPEVGRGGGVDVRSSRAVENDPQLECTLGTLKAVHRAFYSADNDRKR